MAIFSLFLVETLYIYVHLLTSHYGIGITTAYFHQFLHSGKSQKAILCKKQEALLPQGLLMAGLSIGIFYTCFHKVVLHIFPKKLLLSIAMRYPAGDKCRVYIRMLPALAPYSPYSVFRQNN